MKWLKKNDIYSHEKQLTEYLIDKLRKESKIEVYLPESKDNILGIVSINVDGYQPSDVGMILSEDFGICVRTGYHCSPFVHDFIGSKDKLGTVRISLGAFSTQAEIDAICDAIMGL